MKRFFKDYRYEIIVAIGGAVVMILELVGARMVAPFFGTSIYVWTAMIGVILGALSLGYWYGGVLADRKASDDGLMRVLVFAAGAILMCVIIQETLLRLVADLSVDIRIATLLAAAILFAPAAILLGIVSPYVAKLRLSSLKTAGVSIGRLYAAGTFGSIVGTFLAGYWLIGWFGNSSLGFSLVILLVALSFVAYQRGWVALRGLVASLAVLGVLLPSSLPFGTIADIDSEYSRYIVQETSVGKPLRSLVTDPFGIQSAQYVGEPDTLALEYTKRFMTVADVYRESELLVVGGGAYSFPHAVARKYPERTVHVVEIDPKLTEISRDFFNLKVRPNLKTHHADGRVFLNQAASGRYGVVFLDAFTSLTPPYQLTTREATLAAKQSVTSGGLVVANIIASREDPYGRAVAATYRSLFDYVDFYPVYSLLKPSDRQNMIVVMTDSQASRERIRSALRTKPVSVESGIILTDDFAPIEQLING